MCIMMLTPQEIEIVHTQILGSVKNKIQCEIITIDGKFLSAKLNVKLFSYLFAMIDYLARKSTWFTNENLAGYEVSQAC